MAQIELGVRFKMFTSNGTFIVPDNVTKIYVTGCGGGGGGTYFGAGLNGGGGGTTSLGSLISLPGGGGALFGAGIGGTAGGPGSTAGTYSTGELSIGGGSMFGIPGKSFHDQMIPASGYGAGGCGNSGSALSPLQPESGGGGASCFKQEISTTPGTSHAVTIGSGGSGANGNAYGLSGTSGFLLVEW